jgi:hypothetical protein
MSLLDPRAAPAGFIVCTSVHEDTPNGHNCWTKATHAIGASTTSTLTARAKAGGNP